MRCSVSDFEYYCPNKQRNVFFDYYALFNIDKCATEEQIRKAYRNLAKQYHPDKCNREQKENSNEQFKIIGDAYQNLLNPEKRSQYNSALSQMEIKQMAKQYNCDGICSILNCSLQELIIAMGICINSPQQFYEYPCQESKQQYKQEQYQQPEYQKLNRKNSTSQCLQNNNIQPQKTIGDSQQSFISNQIDNQNINNNNGQPNNQNAGLVDDQNSNEESEGEPQCQGSDKDSFFQTKTEQNFYQKFSFFNNYNSKQALNPEDFTFLKDIFCNNDKKQDNQTSNHNQMSRKNSQENTNIIYKKFIQSEDQNKQIDNNYQSLKQDQHGEWNFSFNCDEINKNKVSENQSFNINQINIDDQQKKTCKNILKKTHIQCLQKQNQNKKIIERIKNKQPIFQTFVTKRISKKN